MTRSIAIIGTLDTKGEEIEYIKQSIEGRGHRAIVIDVGVLGKAAFEPSISRREVARAGGASLEEITAFNSEEKAMGVMAEGASKVIKDLYLSSELDGALALGGTTGTSLALTVMQVLPIGVPKIILSTVAFSPLIPPDAVAADLMMIQWAGGLRGINSVCRKVLDEAAGAIAGAAQAHERKEVIKKKVAGVTSRGIVPSRWLPPLKSGLEQRGYEVAVFHATGMGGRAFEQAVTEGLIDVALDLSTGELTDLICGGFSSAGEHRLEAAGKRGIPQIVAAGSSGTFTWATGKPLPRRFRNRAKRVHNSLVTIVAASKAERAAVGKLMAKKLNKAAGPTAVIIPLDRPPDDPSGSFYDPEGLEAFKKAFNDNIKPQIRVVELDTHINDVAFRNVVLALFNDLMG